MKEKQKEGREDTKAIVLIDCSSIAYAAFHTTGHLSLNHMETGVIYGFFKRLLMMANKFETTDFIFCWDDHKTYRHIDYPEYKKKRTENKQKQMDEDPFVEKSLISLRVQMKMLREVLIPDIGFKNNFIRKLYEADDLLAYWVEKLKNKNKVIMVTSDADMYQCLDHCRIWCPMKKKFFTKEMLLKEYGIKPNQWALAKAIGGCGGDGVIGIAGVADPKKKTSKALKYIRGEIKKGVIKDKIESKEGQAIIKRNLPIVTVPYKGNSLRRMIKRKNKFSRKTFIKIFDDLHFKSFLEKDNFSKWENTFLEERYNG